MTQSSCGTRDVEPAETKREEMDMDSEPLTAMGFWSEKHKLQGSPCKCIYSVGRLRGVYAPGGVHVGIRVH